MPIFHQRWSPEECSDVVCTVQQLSRWERRHIEEALAKTSWVIEGDRGAAKLLDIHPNTLRSRMKKLGVTRH